MQGKLTFGLLQIRLNFRLRLSQRRLQNLISFCKHLNFLAFTLMPIPFTWRKYRLKSSLLVLPGQKFSMEIRMPNSSNVFSPAKMIFVCHYASLIKRYCERTVLSALVP